MNNEKIRYIILSETSKGELFKGIDAKGLERLNLGFDWKEFEVQVAFLVSEGYLTKPYYAGDTIYYYNSVLTEKGESYIKKIVGGRYTMLRENEYENVTIVKLNGKKFENVEVVIGPDEVVIEDGSLPVEEGDKILRLLPNGLTETYIVLDRGFYDRFLDIPAHYQAKVRKESTIDLQRSSAMHFNIGTVYGSNIGTQGNAHIENVFNFEKVNQLIEEHGGEDKEVLRDMIEEIKEFFEDSEKVKKGSLSKFSELMEKHSWITGAVSQMGLGFLTGSLFK
ncbi:hypothetical protein MH215_10385 [Paenibacillus sp. ACRSA]|uniref:hypothetical protein n=1 Tax=Paenibacillus sp. ACRSA TaxID=2918211 RepID=UPI001EF6F815|nr:hypothetical protein [Paenibacillus sp. ACRSA]MCG7377403.1 hypothetical protein [Paenibacillus sp. ACRSA]